MADYPLEDLLARLERERLEADRRYNEALTAVDQAIQQVPEIAWPERPGDDSQLAQRSHILPSDPPPADSSLKGRLRAFIWRLVSPPLEAQQQFNAALVDHLNRTSRTHTLAVDGEKRRLDQIKGALEALVRFESLLVQYLQTITSYVDTRDRRWSGPELWERLSLAEQRLSAFTRDLDQRQRHASPVEPADESAAHRAAARSQPSDAFAGNVDSATYVGFEDLFRGSQRDIRARVEDYVPLFGSAANVLDVGCGRGELLDLLRQRGVTARGVDGNPAMVQICRDRGLDVEQGDALGFLERQDDESFGGVAAIQVVEHFEPRYLVRFLEVAHRKLRSGSPLVLETINPASWVAFFECYLRDITHRQPLHPDTLRYLVQASGFNQVDVQYRQPLDKTYRLERVPDDPNESSSGPDRRLAAVVATINAHADKLNARLFSSMDYAVVARR